MVLVVGLGNPGKKYEQNRHNVGFMAVDELRRVDAPSLRISEEREKFSGSFAKGDGVAILKPMTFMNLSGDSVQPCAAFLKIGPESIVVAHDELDLPFGEVRIKVGGGHAGHNGLRSLIQRLGTPEFTRVRIGVGRPPADFPGDVAAYVLGNFDASERAALPSVLVRAVTALQSVIEHGPAESMNRLNRQG